MTAEDDDFEVQNRTGKTRQGTDVSPEHSQGQVPETVNNQAQTDEANLERKQHPSRA